MISNDIRTEAQSIMRLEGGQRYGQAIFNAAERIYPNARILAGTAVDPFFNDHRVEAFLAAVEDLVEEDEMDAMAAEIALMEDEDYSEDYVGYEPL